MKHALIKNNTKTVVNYILMVSQNYRNHTVDKQNK